MEDISGQKRRKPNEPDKDRDEDLLRNAPKFRTGVVVHFRRRNARWETGYADEDNSLECGALCFNASFSVTCFPYCFVCSSCLLLFVRLGLLVALAL